MTMHCGEKMEDAIKRKAYHKYLFRKRHNLSECAEQDWKEAEKEIKEEMDRMEDRKLTDGRIYGH